MVSASVGVYRIPYADGTTVEVSRDHLTHWPPNRIDLNAIGGPTPYQVVAAADGVVRFIVDGFSANRPNMSPCRNNYVWIEHDNGEWTKYTHMTRRSVTGAAGLEVGDAVMSGQFLGFEDDVGCADGEHLHFEVAVPVDRDDPIDDDGVIRGGSARNRIPRVCSIPGRRFVDGRRHVAASCPPVDVLADTIGFGSVRLGTSQRRSCAVINLARRDVTVTVPASPGGAVFAWFPRTVTLAPGGIATVEVTFTPTSTLPAQVTLNVRSDAGAGSVRVGITGKGMPSGQSDPPESTVPFRLSPSLLILGAVQVGSTRTADAMIVNNSGTRSVGVDVAASAGGPFSWSALRTTIPPSGSCPVRVRFSPTSTAPVHAEMVVRATDGTTVKRLSITGKGAGGIPQPDA